MNPHTPAFAVQEVIVTYEQEQDSCSPSRDYNTLTIRTVGGPDMDATYLVLETTRWAIDSPAELSAALADFTQRAAGLLEDTTTRGLTPHTQEVA